MTKSGFVLWHLLLETAPTHFPAEPSKLPLQPGRVVPQATPQHPKASLTIILGILGVYLGMDHLHPLSDILLSLGCFVLLPSLRAEIPGSSWLFFFVFISVSFSLKCLMTLGYFVTFESRALSSCWAALCLWTRSNCGVHQSKWLGTVTGELLAFGAIKV